MGDTVATTGYPVPALEGFYIQVRQGDGFPNVGQIVQQELGDGWDIQPLGTQPGYFDLVKQDSGLSVGAAWQAAYRLRAHPDVTYAEPLFAVAVDGRTDWNPPAAAAPSAPDAAVRDIIGLIGQICMPADNPPESAEPEWSIRQIHVPEAWAAFFPPSGGAPGTGIVIGHPDTGYQLHPEIKDNLLLDRDYDFVDNDDDAKDDLEGGFLATPGHGTETASVIVSPRGAPAGQVGPAVSGVAGGAGLIPFRVSTSVVLLSMLNLARAIERATAVGAHVISISMGGLGCERLRQAILFAQQNGVIVLAAAGNCVRFVIWPAAYDEVIAVAASDALGKTWSGSSRGSTVDVTAPGAGVWHAEVRRQGTGVVFSVEQGAGTSLAVAAVAGLAALWLAHHGLAALRARYPGQQLPRAFNQILRATCVPQTDPSWSPGDFGAGLVDAMALLSAPLPDAGARDVVPPALFVEAPGPRDQGGVATFAHLFEQIPAPAADAAPSGARTVAAQPLPDVLAALLGTDAASVPARLAEVGQELAFHLASDPNLYWQFAGTLAAAGVAPQARAVAPRDAGAAPTEPIPLAALRGSLLSKDVSPALRSQVM